MLVILIRIVRARSLLWDIFHTFCVVGLSVLAPDIHAHVGVVVDGVFPEWRLEGEPAVVILVVAEVVVPVDALEE